MPKNMSPAKCSNIFSLNYCSHYPFSPSYVRLLLSLSMHHFRILIQKFCEHTDGSHVTHDCQISEIKSRFMPNSPTKRAIHSQYLFDKKKKNEIRQIEPTFDCLKSMLVRTVRWCNGCNGLALLPNGAFGDCSEPCISLLNAYNWNGFANGK